MAQVQYRGTGRRKTSVARVRLVPGDGKIKINDREMENYFPREALQKQVTGPLKTTETDSRFDVLAKVEGGGLNGQAGAVRLGIARALTQADEDLRMALKKEGYLSRDARMTERKKYGLSKARRSPQWSKR